MLSRAKTFFFFIMRFGTVNRDFGPKSWKFGNLELSIYLFNFKGCLIYLCSHLLSKVKFNHISFKDNS